jgi:hypothetical protein
MSGNKLITLLISLRSFSVISVFRGFIMGQNIMASLWLRICCIKVMKCDILYETMRRLFTLHNMSNNNTGRMQVKMQIGITIMPSAALRKMPSSFGQYMFLWSCSNSAVFFVSNIEVAIIVKIIPVDKILA